MLNHDFKKQGIFFYIFSTEVLVEFFLIYHDPKCRYQSNLLNPISTINSNYLEFSSYQYSQDIHHIILT
jgi:hypothetical protein